MKKFKHYFLDNLNQAAVGELCLTQPDGEKIVIKGDMPGPTADFIIHDWTVLQKVMTRGDIGLGEAYFNGLCDSEDIATFLTYCCVNMDAIYRQGNPSYLQRLLFYFYNNLLKLNTRSGSKRNIFSHYDISDDFYKLWLDKTMTYSSALRANDQQTLTDAQINKYQRIISQLSLQGSDVLEIGCGWGGFVEQAVQHDATVTAITNSTSHYHYATQRVKQAQIHLQDYRDITRQFDHVVSIEMFEAVGQRYWRQYFNKINQALNPSGKALIQTITVADELYEAYRKTSDYIRHYIFPGGMLASKSLFIAEANRCGLVVSNLYEFGQDYAWTLRQWLENFHHATSELQSMGYSTPFIRGWEFYLAECIAVFSSQRTNVMQVELSHG